MIFQYAKDVTLITIMFHSVHNHNDFPHSFPPQRCPSPSGFGGNQEPKQLRGPVGGLLTAVPTLGQGVVSEVFADLFHGILGPSEWTFDELCIGVFSLFGGIC